MVALFCALVRSYLLAEEYPPNGNCFACEAHCSIQVFTLTGLMLAPSAD
jgi:hypothetical protein